MTPTLALAVAPPHGPNPNQGPWLPEEPYPTVAGQRGTQGGVGSGPGSGLWLGLSRGYGYVSVVVVFTVNWV